MKVLLEDGCNPNIKDNSGETLLIDAIKKKKLNAIELLLKNDCKVTIKNDQGMSPIGQAVTSMNHEALVTILKTEAGKSSVHEP
jgi:ankyrin repeat protein